MAKRIFDFVGAFIGLVLLSPVFLVVAIAIRAQSRGPVFYRSLRVGLRGRQFRMLKFRTMCLNADTMGGSSTPVDDHRITPIGALLRRFKIDELPQLINVLIGDMSLVGPRPQVPWAVGLYSEKEMALLSVRPGVTDYASIRFANEAEILQGSVDPDADYLRLIAPEKNRLGLEYVRTRSMMLDCRLVAATLWSVIGGRAEWFLPIKITAPRGNERPLE